MNKIIQMTILLYACFSSAQTFNLDQFEKIYRLKTEEKKVNYIYDEGFTKEVNKENNNLVFIKKKFIKKTQTFDEEMLVISGDSLIYLFNNPKKFVPMKNSISAFHKPMEMRDNAFEDKKEVYIIGEKDLKRQYSEELVKFHSILYYRKPINK